jgi:predicted nucleic acid-binding protein
MGPRVKKADTLHYIDTNVLIALVCGPVEPTKAQRAFVRSIESGGTRAVSSELTLAE